MAEIFDKAAFEKIRSMGAILSIVLTLYCVAAAASTLEHPDQVCASCHQAIFDHYEKTTMAQGSGRAVDGFIAAEFDHSSSGIHYRVYREDGQVWLSYDRANKMPLHGRRQLSYYIGSGHRGRTYLFQQDDLWFEAPINYYGKKQLWDMAPGYTYARSMPFTLPVDSNCLHCHASEVSSASDGVRNKYTGPPFAAAGVGCAACHGDPASHLEAEAAHRGTGSIVNPAKLQADQRDSTCLQCHLEGDAAIYKAGRSLTSYEPGEKLDDSVVYFVNTSRPDFGNRASSQYEALLRSGCKRAAGDQLTCTTCHDPHNSPSPEQRIPFYRNKCLACHTGVVMATRHHAEQQDCAVCHMPTRATQDISHEQLTDHDIERQPPTALNMLGLRDLDQGQAAKVVALSVVGNEKFTERELGLAYAQLARGGDQHSGEEAMRLLAKAEAAGSLDEEVHAQFGFLQQLSGNKERAIREYKAALQLEPLDVTVLSDLAVLYAAGGHGDQAIKLLEQAVDLDPSQTRAGMNLAFLQCSFGQPDEALKTLQKVSSFNPDDPSLRSFMASGTYGSKRCLLHPKIDSVPTK